MDYQREAFKNVFAMQSLPGYNLTEPSPCGYSDSMHASLGACTSELSAGFFSPNNVEHLQHGIIEQFFLKTGIPVDKQKKEDLLCIMRSVFLGHSRNLSYAIQEQLNDLNTIVIEECVRKVAVGVEQYLTYLKDASTLPVPISRGQSTTIKGSNSTFNNQIGF